MIGSNQEKTGTGDTDHLTAEYPVIPFSLHSLHVYHRYFHRTYLSCRSIYPGISRSQAAMICHIAIVSKKKTFAVKDITLPGLSYRHARNYVLLLVKIGFISIVSRARYSVTPLGYTYYTAFLTSYLSHLSQPIHW